MRSEFSFRIWAISSCTARTSAKLLLQEVLLDDWLIGDMLRAGLGDWLGDGDADFLGLEIELLPLKLVWASIFDKYNSSTIS